MLKKVIRILNSFIPKQRKLILFMSVPDYADNPKALFEYIKRHYNQFDLRWIVKNKESVSLLKEKGIKVTQETSLNALLWLLRAGTIITSHLSRVNVRSSKQMYVSLWHGVIIKALGYMDNRIKHKSVISYNDRFFFAISTSKTVNTVIAASFHYSPKQIYITGQPRNDSLFNPLSESDMCLLLGNYNAKYSRIVFYMPTFRQGFLMHKEGRALKANNLFGFREFDLEAFQDFLTKERICLICKFHPFEERFFEKTLQDLDGSVFLLKSSQLLKMEIELYRILGRADLLVTDYSSVFFDYLLLDRPILFAPTDFDEYEHKRGFVLEPYSFWTPGPKVTNQAQLQTEIINSFTIDGYYRKERITINSIINRYKDDKSCERVTRLIMEKIDGSEKQWFKQSSNDSENHYE